MSGDQAGEPRPQVQTRTRQLRPCAVAFGIALGGTLLVALLQGAKPFYYDSGGYWLLGETLAQGGHFSLLNFTSPLRGYLLPLAYHGLHELATTFAWTDSSTAKAFLALVFSFIGAVLTPKLAELAWPQQRWGVSRRLALMALLIVFWSGYLNYPLSDFPALAMVLLALVSISHPRSAAWMLLAGAATGAAGRHATLLPPARANCARVGCLELGRSSFTRAGEQLDSQGSALSGLALARLCARVVASITVYAQAFPNVELRSWLGGTSGESAADGRSTHAAL